MTKTKLRNDFRQNKNEENFSSCAFGFDQKVSRNVAQIIPQYYVTKFKFSLFKSIDHVPSISEYVLEKH